MRLWSRAWDNATHLRWVHWAGVGVELALFPEFIESPVILTNSRGVFDRAMSEYVLGMILSLAKRFPETTLLQSEAKWNYRFTEQIDQKCALVVGLGGIGHAIARLLGAAGMIVLGVAREEREDKPTFERIYARRDLNQALRLADYVIIALPLTRETHHMFGREQFEAMKPTSRLVNIGRGPIVDEPALITALREGTIAGAALDVFEEEPLPKESPLWSMPQVIVSPHMSGDFLGYEKAIVECFLRNYARYRDNQPLFNVVDKSLGFVPS
jgi:phosphoglycerate dehydrogenase-like enzyme